MAAWAELGWSSAAAPVSPRSWCLSTLQSRLRATYLSRKRSFLYIYVLTLKSVFMDSPVLVVSSLAISFSFSSRNLSSKGCHTCHHTVSITANGPILWHAQKANKNLLLVFVPPFAGFLALRGHLEQRTFDSKVELSIYRTVSRAKHAVCGHILCF
jgi:hypothetical protein